ncbi:TPRXL [Biomphalaria glabrata]|nr:TPRXL [Biomphalaria glabrata]
MSSRRTRSGTPLGGSSSESRRLRQTPSRKQHQQKAAEETNASGVEGGNNNKTEFGQKEISEKKSLHAEQKGVNGSPVKSTSPNPTSNIWDRLEGAQKENINPTKKCSTKCATIGVESEQRTLEPETARSCNDAPAAEIHKKSRKPEILLSLLEGEPTVPVCLIREENSNQIKDVENCNLNSRECRSDTSDRKQTTNDESLSTFPLAQPICFFPNCDHRHEPRSDFSHIPEVPGEPFFVSLSKDKNKELNMVKTSSGMVRVGCGIRQFLPASHTFSDPYSRDAAFSSQDQVVGRNKSQSPPVRGAAPLCPSEARVHVVRIDKESGKRVSRCKEKHDKDSIGKGDSETKRIMLTDSPTDWSPSAEQSDRLLELDFKRHPFTSETNAEVVNPHLTKSLMSNKSSKHPIMEEILTEQQHSTCMTSAASAVCIHDMSTEEMRQSKKTISLLKPPTLSNSTMPSFSSAPALTTASPLSTILTSVASLMPPALACDVERENKNLVKRSERIRCKSGVSTAGLSQSVISTMKPVDAKSKIKSSIQKSKKKSKLSISKENQKKKNGSSSKKHNFTKKSLKDSSRSKVTMSREVMDAIVQSIEETVSRAREEKNSSSTDQMLSNNSDYNELSSSLSENSKESTCADQWPENSYDEDGDDSTDVSSTTTNDSHVHSSRKSPKVKSLKSKRARVKKSSIKSKKTGKHSPGSSRTPISKEKIKTTVSVCASLPPVGSDIEASAKETSSTETANTSTEGEVKAAVTLPGKRFRKKTRKAEEALGDYDVFCEEDWPVKKSKPRKRSSSSESTGSNNQRRPRRSSQICGLMADPVLEEHAFILWASENRSQLEVQNPGASTCEVDAMLSSRWCDVTDTVKSRFFFRAREAFSDDDRHMIRTSSMSEIETSALGDYFSDSDSVLIEFIRLPIDRQRELLRKWLKFFQKMLPKKEYVEFIVTFKRACGSINCKGKPKRTRMRCLDPAHYKMLFDMIRLAKPRVLEIYRAKKLKEKKMVSDTYSMMLQKLIYNDIWPHTMVGCRSEMLTEILQDLDIPDRDISPTASSTSLMVAEGMPSSDVDEVVRADVGDAGVEQGRDTRVHITVVNKMPQILEFKLDHGGNDFSFDETDYPLLNTDLALSLLSSVNEIKELPHIDQQTLDQIFLAPPRMSVTPSPQRRTINPYGRRLDNLTAHLSPSITGPGCPPRLLSSETVSYSKMNLNYTSTKLTSSPTMVIQHMRPTLSTSTTLPHKYIQQRGESAPPISPARSVCCRKDSPMDMHSYSITVESMVQNHLDSPMPKCIKIDPLALSSQTKVRLQSLQLPVTSRIHPKSKLHPRVVPVSCGFQQRFAGQLFSSANTSFLDKINPHHMCNMAPSTTGNTPSSSSRLYSQSIGAMTAQSPLITSLSPLRNIKYTQATQVYSSHCQMMPYRPRMQITAGTGGIGSRRTAHTIPLGTTLKAGATRAQGGLHQIKVCLPTQSLKIPIAKLRGSRKTSYVKGKLKNFGLQTNPFEPYTTLTSSSQSAQLNNRSGTPTSLLTKVLNLQVKNETVHSSMSVDGLPCTMSRPATSAFIGTMRPVGSQSGHKSGSQLQLISMVTSSGHSSELRSTLSPQTAVVVSPLSLSRNSLVSHSSTSTTYTSSTSVSASQFLDLPCTIHSAGGHIKRTNVGRVISLDSVQRSYERDIAKVIPINRAATEIGREGGHVIQQTRCTDSESPVEFIVVGTCTAETEVCKEMTGVDEGCRTAGQNGMSTVIKKVNDTDGVDKSSTVGTVDSMVLVDNESMNSSFDTEGRVEAKDVYFYAHESEGQCLEASTQDREHHDVMSDDHITEYHFNNEELQHDLTSGTWRKITGLGEEIGDHVIKDDNQSNASGHSIEVEHGASGAHCEEKKQVEKQKTICADNDRAGDVPDSNHSLHNTTFVRSVSSPIHVASVDNEDQSIVRQLETCDRINKVTAHARPETSCILVENLGPKGNPPVSPPATKILVSASPSLT